jgi:hypothetical protein
VEIGTVLPAGNGRQGRRIAPTDVAQFIRLEQCRRYLRLRLYERAQGLDFMYDFGVKPQSIPPILTRSGESFEKTVERSVAQRHWKINFVEDMAHAGQRQDDNERVVQIARDLERGETVVLFQPRLRVDLADWLVRGDVDILRMERDADGKLSILVADMKSSTTAKVEHRLQVAFYVEMLSALLAHHGVAWEAMDMGVLYRGPAEGDAGLSPQEIQERERQRDAAEGMFGTRDGLLEIVADPESYRGSVRDLVTDPQSVAVQAAEAPFEDVPYHLSYKCDGCLYNEFCMKWSAERDDLSLLPYLTAEEKSALQRAGVRTVRELAALKEPAPKGSGPTYASELVAPPGKEALVARLSATWPVGPHLDELIFRARRYRRWKKDPIEAPSSIPSKGYGSLPYSDAQQNPNLIRVYIDAQHDYLQDRIYMLGALVVASEGGQEPASRRREIVHLLDGPPEPAEREEALLVHFVTELMRILVEVAAPDEDGKPRAPIHLIFYNRFEQRLLLDGLARHFERILGATPLYDFVTQLAAFDSPIATFLDGEIRELKNYPMVCQSLQAVAAFLGFDWNEGQPYRENFRTRMFDFWGKFDEPPREGEVPWYTSRARFNSQIPLEYAYAAWGALPDPPAGKADDFESYRGATIELLEGFHARRLQAMERIAKDFSGNKLTEKRAFNLPDLATFEGKAQTLAQALDEFVIVERHVELAAWKSARLAPPERRVLSGQTLVVRYHEADQDPGIAEHNRENARRKVLKDRFYEAWRAKHPDAKRVTLSKDQREECNWSQDGMRFRLRLETAGIDCDLDEMLGLRTFREGESLVLYERTTVDSRLPEEQQVPFMPTSRQLLYGMRVTLVRTLVDRDSQGKATAAWAEVEMRAPRQGGENRGFVFGSRNERPLVNGECYTLDADPDDWYGYFCAKVTEELCSLESTSPGNNNALYDRLTTPMHRPIAVAADSDLPTGPALPIAGVGATSRLPCATRLDAQSRFMDGLVALQQAGAIHPFDANQRDYIASHGNDSTLLVQGPPGTGKSYSTAFALFARMQGALAAGIDFRVCVSAKTHAATDVLLNKVVEVQALLHDLQSRHPNIFDTYLDDHLLRVPLFRAIGRNDAPVGVGILRRKSERLPGEPLAIDAIREQPHCIVATTPGGVYRALKDGTDSLFGEALFDCLVLDEASQMNLPEAVMAALPLKTDGQLIVVGDHRQMPPIVKHDWASEPRRTYREFRSYESLFLALLPLEPPMVKLAESFRLHADMAAFLRREIYERDGIPYFSRNRRTLKPAVHPDPFVAAVLSPGHTIVVVVHDEAQSMLRNPFELTLIAPVLEALADGPYHLEPRHGLGVVVPHRAQRAALQESVPCLTVLDPATGAIALSAVDTVERFQGDERDAIVVSATESDADYLLVSSQFLLDPRRLTVALSRAKHKMVLVASKSVFSIFSADEETFEHSQLWKNLLRRTCTEKLWEGERDGKRVTVWGNQMGAIHRDELLALRWSTPGSNSTATEQTQKDR